MDIDATGFEKRGLIGEGRGPIRRVATPGFAEEVTTDALGSLGCPEPGPLDGLADEIPVVFTVNKKGFVAIRNRVKNTRPSIFRPYVAWNAEELWIDPKAGGDTASR